MTYGYDPLNRLTYANSLGVVMSEVISYDAMGNINTLNRDGAGSKQYNYDGNRLTSVTGLTGAYGYDLNGNATTDGRNGMGLTYNFLNLPVTANKTGTALSYIYDAAGQKLAKTATVNGITTNRKYIGGIEYNDNTIDLIHTEEGVAQNIGGTYTYHYNLSDHLSNVRYTFDIYNGAVRKLQSDDYYAFGKRRSVAPVSLDNKYLYNGKELQEELASAGEDGQLDYGARFYDPVVGRWNVVDPLAELSRRYSPYIYGNNNPIKYIDPDGMMTTDANGNISSDNTEEARYMFLQLQNSSQQNDDGPGKKKEKKEKQEQGYTPVPPDYKKNGLPGFPGSKPLPRKQGARTSWDLGGLKPKGSESKLPKGSWGEWDSQHGEVEVYNKKGEHQGAWDPESGEENEGKQRDDRKPTYNRFGSSEPDANETLKNFIYIDGLRVRPILPSNFKPHPAVSVGAVIGAVLLVAWMFAGN